MIRLRPALLIALSLLALSSFEIEALCQTKEELKASLGKQPNSTILATDLLSRLTHNPRLLNADYLEYYLGPKSQSIKQRSQLTQYTNGLSAKTIWQPQSGPNIWDKLEISQQGQSNYMAEFMATVPQMVHLQVKDIDKALGVRSKRSFDENGQPVDIYVPRPDTQVLIYKMPAAADIRKIRIKYAGADPGPPLPADMEEASQYRRSMAFEHYNLGNYRQAIILLNEHLKSRPNDTEAHLKLAESYKANSCLTESINEYRTALDQSGDNADLHSRCLAGLRSLKIDQPIINTNQAPVQSTQLSQPTAKFKQPESIKSIKPANPFDVGF